MPSLRRIAVYPGSFDPVTNGHVDIVRRAVRLFDKVVVAVSVNAAKSPLFSLAERKELLAASLKKEIRSGRVAVHAFEGLLVRFARSVGACALVRGLRAVSDFEYEFQMALMNRHQAPGLETVFLMPDEKNTYLSSSLIKDIVRLGGRGEGFVPPAVLSHMKRKYAARVPPFRR
jgi:pantetheine-phosphate adenylyltransferase